jgi:hypothetical protein
MITGSSDAFNSGQSLRRYSSFVRNFAGLSIVFIIGCYLFIFVVRAVRSFRDTIASRNTPVGKRLEVDA